MLGRRRVALVQVAQVVLNGPELLPRELEGAVGPVEVAAVA